MDDEGGWREPGTCEPDVPELDDPEPSEDIADAEVQGDNEAVTLVVLEDPVEDNVFFVLLSKLPSPELLPKLLGSVNTSDDDLASTPSVTLSPISSVKFIEGGETVIYNDLLSASSVVSEL